MAFGGDDNDEEGQEQAEEDEEPQIDKLKIQQPERSRNTRIGSSNTNETHLLTIDQTLDPEVPIPAATNEVEKAENKPVTVAGQIIETEHEQMSGTN